MRFKTKCIDVTVNTIDKEHCLVLSQDNSNTGMFGSKIARKQFEKVENVLSKRYVKLPFGIIVLI